MTPGKELLGSSERGVRSAKRLFRQAVGGGVRIQQ
jgi:hypothetical protein